MTEQKEAERRPTILCPDCSSAKLILHGSAGGSLHLAPPYDGPEAQGTPVVTLHGEWLTLDGYADCQDCTTIWQMPDSQLEAMNEWLVSINDWVTDGSGIRLVETELKPAGVGYITWSLHTTAVEEETK